MGVTRSETLQGLADAAGFAAMTRVGEVLALIGDDDLIADHQKYADVRIVSYPILPEALIDAILDWLEAQQFCPGPPPAYAYIFHQAPDLNALYPGDFRPEFGPVFYRGRLDGTARVLVVGQDPATDEQLANRTFVGFSGQRLQRFLDKIGLARSYVIVNTLHLGVLGTFSSNASLEAASRSDIVAGWRNRLLDRIVADNPIEAIVTVGSPARRAVEDYWPGADAFAGPASRIVSIWHPSARDESALLETWNEGLARLGDLVTPDAADLVDLTPYGSAWTSDDSSDIPRRDLPFGTPPWHGTGGSTRSRRPAPNQVEWTSP